MAVYADDWESEAASLKLSFETYWYLRDREIPLPTCVPKWKTPEGNVVPGAKFYEDAVDRIVYEVMPKLMHTQGRWAGQPLKPDPWQIAYVIAPVYGWKAPNEDGRIVRVVRTEYVDIPRKNGKGIALEVPILTAEGWKNFGDLVVGDRVHAEDGTLTEVTFVSDVHNLDCYRVTFADGQSITCDAEHHWTVFDRWAHGGRDHLVTTERKYVKGAWVTLPVTELAEKFRIKRVSQREFRYSVGTKRVLDRPEVDLPLDPYLFGAWLGDGASATARISTDDPEIVRAFELAGFVVRHVAGFDYHVKGGLQQALREIGVLGDKHVPVQYLHASAKQRLALLQGLMDTDGTVVVGARRTTPRCEFTSTKERLALAVLFLARSLGWKATIREGLAKLDGRVIGPKWRVSWAAYDDESPFRLDRKTARLSPRPARPQRSSTNKIVNVERVASTPTRCIQVAHPSHQFLVGTGLVPTHNTTIAGAQAIVLLAADGEGGAQVFAAAAGKDQARYCFNPVKAIAEKSPALKKRLKTTQNRINRIADEGFFAVVSSFADLLHGANVHGAIIDELHVHKTRDLVDALETGTGAREQPLIIIITTADDGRSDTIYAEKRKYCEQLARGVLQDPAFYGVVFGADDEDDPFDEKTWEKANPGIGVSPTRAFLRAEAKKAMNSPANLSRFKRLHCGIRTKQQTTYIDLKEWDRNASMVVESQMKGRDAYGGLDLAAVSDLTALVWILPDNAGGHDVLWRIWMPEAKLRELDERTAGAGTVWVDNGYLMLTPGETTDYDYIKLQVERDAGFLSVREIGYDPWNSSQLVINLENEGMPMVQVRQGYGTLSSPTKELDRLLKEGTAEHPLFRHGGNPCARWQADNFAVAMDPAGNVKPDKAAAGDKIDAIAASIMALDRAMRHVPKRRSVYESRGLDTA